MNNRRKFLLQTGMAATALIAAKPYKTFAGITNPFTGSGSGNVVLLLHTGNTGYQQAASHINTIKQQHANTMLLHAGNKVDATTIPMHYDMTPDQHAKTSYKIIYKGNIKVGVIDAMQAGNDVISEVNHFSTFLKKEKNCDLVVCLSPLGYKNKNGVDDIKLAERSANLDVIISGHSKNFSEHPIIAHNEKKEEVIITYSSANALDLGKVEIFFDKDRRKKTLDFHNSGSTRQSLA